MNEVLYLLKKEADPRRVFCKSASISMREFYEANANDFYPERKFILSDYLDYDDERMVEYEGRRYRVLRTYRTGQELEIVVTRASAVESAAYG